VRAVAVRVEQGTEDREGMVVLSYEDAQWRTPPACSSPLRTNANQPSHRVHRAIVLPPSRPVEWYRAISHRPQAMLRNERPACQAGDGEGMANIMQWYVPTSTSHRQGNAATCAIVTHTPNDTMPAVVSPSHLLPAWRGRRCDELVPPSRRWQADRCGEWRGARCRK